MLRVCQTHFNRIIPLDLFTNPIKSCSVLRSIEGVHVKKYSANVTRLNKLPRYGNNYTRVRTDKSFVKKHEHPVAKSDVIKHQVTKEEFHRAPKPKSHNVQVVGNSAKQKPVVPESQCANKGTKTLNKEVTYAKVEKSRYIEKRKKQGQDSSKDVNKHQVTKEEFHRVPKPKSHNVQVVGNSAKQKPVVPESQCANKGTKTLNKEVTYAKVEKSRYIEKQKKQGQDSSKDVNKHQVTKEEFLRAPKPKSHNVQVVGNSAKQKPVVPESHCANKGTKTDNKAVIQPIPKKYAKVEKSRYIEKQKKQGQDSSKDVNKHQVMKEEFHKAPKPKSHNVQVVGNSAKQKPVVPESQCANKGTKTDNKAVIQPIPKKYAKVEKSRHVEKQKKQGQDSSDSAKHIKTVINNLRKSFAAFGNLNKRYSANQRFTKESGKISPLLKQQLYDKDIIKEKVLAVLMDDKPEVAALMIRKEQMDLVSEAWSRQLRVDISVYNSLMQSYAKQGDFSKVNGVLQQLDMWAVAPNLQTYAHYLECLARRKKFDSREGFEILKRITEENLDVRDIFNDCSFVKDEWFYTEKALKSLHPDFEAHPPPPPLDYSSGIVQSLNSPVEDGVEMPHKDAITKEEILTSFENQLKWEMNGYVQVSTKFDKQNLSSTALLMRKKLDTLRQEWRKTLKHQFQKKLKESQFLRKTQKYDQKLVPFLKLLPVSDFVDLLMMDLEHILETCIYVSPPTWYMQKLLGQKVLDKCVLLYNQKNGIIDQKTAVYKEYLEFYLGDYQKFRSHRECWESIVKHKDHRYRPTLDKPSFEWRHMTMVDIGQWLYDILVDHVKFDPRFFDEKETELKAEYQIPAVYIKYETYENFVVEEIMPHPALARAFQRCVPEFKKFDVSVMPMLVPPVPWKSRYSGGMINKPTEMVKSNRNFVTENAVDNVLKRAGNINPVLDALNVLSSCPWKINQPILDVMLKVFNSKKGNKKLNIAPHPSTLPILPKIKYNMTKKEIFHTYDARKKMKKILTENYSQWCTTLYQLAIANKLRNKTVWFPHNIDFRGRAYPVSPSMNYMGNDLMRGLLIFAKGKPLGEEGFKWLKIHVINLMGTKKRSSNRERLRYAEEMMDEILDSADNPLTGNKWWQDTEDPWTTLAACKELAAAVRSGNPAAYVSQLPIHQDGSCNGLQHYAALGRDQKGGESVNLCPFDEPKDVYSDVVELVEKQRAKDAANGYKLAQALEGYVTRKTIKQTVMTTVYGVTLYGAMHQIKKNMSEVEGKVLDEDVYQKSSVYLAKITLNSMSKIFHASREIQDWFIRCATVLAKHRKTVTEWETPLGLPVVQPYVKKLEDYDYRPNPTKQKNSFPPNFIHSLDATHMMMTALHCHRKGITYVSVHDCYWTHACDVDTMNKITREQFVLLHSQPILENLSKFLLEKFGEHPSKDPSFKEKKSIQNYVRNTFSEVPSRGNLDLNNVLDSVYFFS